MTNPVRPVVSVGAVVFKNNAVLLVKRKNPPCQDEWAIPGGKVQTGETLQQAAEREILEETGITILAKDSIYTFDLIESDENNNILFHYVIIDLEADYLSGNIQASDDALESCWASNDDARNMNINNSTRELLKKKYNFSF
ncbi:MAG: NUDIX hydrolase [Gammaproteobacteria bacterium]